MRVTQGMLAQNSLRHLNNSFGKMGKLQDQLATGKKITRPSDDPVVAMKGMYYRTNLTEIQQYKRNLSEVYAWMDNSEAAIEHIGTVMHRARELMVQGMNDTYSQEDRDAMAAEIAQIKEDFAQVANTQVAGRYIFNGMTIDKPRVIDASDPSTVSTENDPFMVEVSKGIKLQANVNVNNVFNQEIFQMWNDIEGALKSSDSEKLGQLLNDFDKQTEVIQAERSELGARYNRLQMVEDRIGYQEVVATRTLSDNEDADIERVITELLTQESVHRASLSTSARIIQPTLMDFLR